jgi:YVTN family beta-propeller protein
VGSPSGARTTLNTIFLFDAVSQTYRGTVTVGNAPTGIGVSADGGKVYVTNSADGTVSVIDTQFGTLAKTITVGTSPSAIAAMPSIPPAITTQPADQRIPYRGTATVAIQATGTAPLNYQWYQGTSGDTSNPVQGATGSSSLPLHLPRQPPTGCACQTSSLNWTVRRRQ